MDEEVGEIDIDWRNVDRFGDTFIGLTLEQFTERERDVVSRPLSYRQKIAHRLYDILSVYNSRSRARMIVFKDNWAFCKWMRTLYYSVGVLPVMCRAEGGLRLMFPTCVGKIIFGRNTGHIPFKLRKSDRPFDYVGFQLAEDPHFVFDDWVVTHNTSMIGNTCRAFPTLKTVITAPGIDLIQQLESAMREACPGRDVRGIYSGSKHKEQGEGITVVSMDSLEKCDFDGTKLVLVDEPHAVVTDSRGMFLNSFRYARRLGFGATLEGRYDRSDILIEALLGPILSRRTFLEAVAEGAVCQIDVLIINLPFKDKNLFRRDTAYKKAFWLNPEVASIVKLIQDTMPRDWQILSFINNEDQADYLHSLLPDNTVAMAKKMKGKKERRALFDKMASGEITRCIASNIYSTGVTFSNLRCAINMEGGGAFITCVQKPGRLAEVREGKRSGIMVDFRLIPERDEDESNMTSNRSMGGLLASDSFRRIKIYRDKGYRLHFSSTSPEEITTKLKEIMYGAK